MEVGVASDNGDASEGSKINGVGESEAEASLRAEKVGLFLDEPQHGLHAQLDSVWNANRALVPATAGGMARPVS